MYSKITILMEERGVNAHQLEQALGLGNGSVAKWKKHTPRLETVKKLADYFNVSIEYFLD